MNISPLVSLVNDKITGKENFGGRGIFSLLSTLILGIPAAYLSWQCNKNSDTWKRVLFAVLSFIFGGWYLLYYFFTHAKLRDGRTKPILEIQNLKCD